MIGPQFANASSCESASCACMYAEIAAAFHNLLNRPSAHQSRQRTRVEQGRQTRKGGAPACLPQAGVVAWELLMWLVHLLPAEPAEFCVAWVFLSCFSSSGGSEIEHDKQFVRFADFRFPFPKVQLFQEPGIMQNISNKVFQLL